MVHTLWPLLDLILSGSILPATVVQAEGLDATFLCQLPNNDGAIEWQINGTSLRNMNVGEGQIRREGRGEATETLIISALPQFNGTSVVCILYIIEPNGTVVFIESVSAMLIVQGYIIKKKTLYDNMSIIILYHVHYFLMYLHICCNFLMEIELTLKM